MWPWVFLNRLLKPLPHSILSDLVVAFAGLLLGLFSIFDESARTWLTLRHLGFSNRQFLLSAGIRRCGNRAGCLVEWFPDRTEFSVGCWSR